MKELGIRVQVNSDAHYPERINNSRAEHLAALKKAGFTSVVEWHDRKWEDTGISDSSVTGYLFVSWSAKDS